MFKKDTFLYYGFVELFTEGFLGVVLGVLIWLTTAILLAFFSWGVFHLVDSVGLSENQAKGIIVQGWFEPKHITTSYMMCGKALVPIKNYHPDTWFVKIKINNKTDNISLSQKDWNSLFLNQEIDCTYKIGRISKSICITGVSW